MLTPRAELLLKTLIERYIAEGQPVGSRTLARHAGLDLSPASVRNVMMDLEELGLIQSPHTSAGRVPTQLGYRMFVDTLLKVQPLHAREAHRIADELKADQDPQQLIEHASHLLSELSRLAGVIMVPRRDEHIAFRHIDFLSLPGRRILVILVTQDGHVDNRIIAVDREYTASELTRAANYFNESYAGVRLSNVKRVLLTEMQQASTDMQQIMDLALDMARKAFAGEPETDELVVSGESNLMDIPDLGDVRTLRRLFEAFNAKRDLLHLLDQSMRATGVKVFIGTESGYAPLADFSVVTASYRIDKDVVGTLGVIGPTRMPYEHVIPIVDLTARILSAALSTENSGPARLESPGG